MESASGTLIEDVTGRRGSRLVGVLKLLRDVLIGLGDIFERKTLLCVALVVLCVVPLVVLEAHSNLLLNDEIYTVHIAQAPSVRDMLSLAREIDLHPPVHYLAQRVTLHSGLPRWLASRLPSLFAVVIVCLALFRWTATRLGNLYGLVAVCVLWLTPLLEFAWSNRPYMLWMAWLCLLLLARDVAVREKRPRWAIPLVFLLTFGMVMTHLLGIACIGPFLLAEVWRTKRLRRVDWALVAALTLPALSGVAFFYQIHHFSENAFPAVNLASFSTVGLIYGLVVGNTAVVIAGCLIAAVVLFGRDGKRLADVDVVGPGSCAGRFSGEDAALLLSLVVLPLLLLVLSDVLHVQFWLRYSYPATVAWAGLAAWIVAGRLPMARIVAAILVISSVGYMVGRMITESGPPGNAGVMVGGRMPIPLGSLDPALPIVTASPMTFVEMSDRESPEIVKRVFYLTDRDAAMQYSHYTLFENEDKIRRLLGLGSQTEAFPQFMTEHPRFYVVGDYGRSDVWLLRKLEADGMTLRYLGKFESTYESDDLFLITKDDRVSSSPRP